MLNLGQVIYIYTFLFVTIKLDYFYKNVITSSNILYAKYKHHERRMLQKCVELDLLARNN